jgi:hypothetical protein
MLQGQATLEKFPVIQHACEGVLGNFINNLTLGLQRLSADWSDVEKLFFTPDQLELLALSAVQATGSESHKGGLNVLIFTFLVQPQGVSPEPEPMTVVVPRQGSSIPEKAKDSDSTIRLMPPKRKLVYKPSDVEIDCRIVANTQAIGKGKQSLKALGISGLGKELEGPSMVEVLNASIPFPLATYRILPRYPGSRQNVPECITKPYGYLEFLTHDKDSDWNFTDANSLKRYFRECGSLLAVARFLRIIDLHAGNVIVHNFRPCIIDLEMSISENFNMGSVSLFMELSPQFAGVCGSCTIDNWVDEQKEGATGANVSFNGSDISLDSIGQDRCDAILQGFQNTMNHLSTVAPGIVDKMRSEGWEKVIVRRNTINTGALHLAMQRLYTRNLSKPFSDELVTDACSTLPAELMGFSKEGVQSIWACYKQVDYPSWYHSTGGLELLDSHGQPCGFKFEESGFHLLAAELKKFQLDSKFLKKEISAGVKMIKSACHDLRFEEYEDDDESSEEEGEDPSSSSKNVSSGEGSGVKKLIV